MPIDYDDDRWRSSPWSLPKDARVLSEAEGPSGLRLPLNRLPPSVPRRALSMERNGDAIAIFIPPLLQKPFLELLTAIEESASRNGIAQVALQGYTPADEAGSWISLGLAADPGVLEVNLPACSSWHEYADWVETVDIQLRGSGFAILEGVAFGSSRKAREAEITFCGVAQDWRPTRFSHDPDGWRRFSVSGSITLHSPICYWLLRGRILASSASG